MNSMEIFRDMHRFLTDIQIGSISCITKDQDVTAGQAIHLHDCFELRLILTSDASRLERIDIIFPRICHRSLPTIENIHAHILGIGGNYTYFLHKNSGLPGYLTSPYLSLLLQSLTSLEKIPDSPEQKEECRLLLSLLYLRAAPDNRTGHVEYRVRDMAQYLLNFYYRQDLSIAGTARLFAISPRYVQQVFRENFSLNPKDYLLKIRMENAARLLKKQQYFIYDIASLCGFSDTHYFTRVFRHYYGCSPRNFLREKGSLPL